MSQCTAQTFHRRRCRNRVVADDPRYCHHHSWASSHQTCLATHARNGRTCTRRRASGSGFCAHHLPIWRKRG